MLLHKKSFARTVLAGLALLTLASSACVKQNEAGVGVTKFDSSAVFGISVEKPVVPGFEVPEAFVDDEPLPQLPTPSLRNPVAPEGPCPPAKLNAFPKASATPQVLGLPPEGLFTWKRNSYIFKNEANTSMPVQVLPFALEGRAIRRVARQSEHLFTFDMVQPDPFNANQSLVTSFVVNNNPALLFSRRVPPRTVGVVATPNLEFRVTDPRDTPGIFISAIETQDKAGKQISFFNPVTPMLIAPLEEGVLRTGQTYSSVGVDALTGSVLYNSGVVGRRTRVDACGEIVEGYAVTLHQTLTSDVQMVGPDKFVQENETRSVDYIFASQFGALPIGENLSLGDVNVDPVAISARWELGGLTPKPLPQGLK